MCTPVVTPEAELHWLALKLVPGLGARGAVQLVERWRSPELVFRASPSELEASGVSGSVAQSIASGCTFEDAVTQQQKIREAGAVTLSFQDPRYPAQLRDIFDPPLLMYARGRVELLESVMVAVVGTRRPSAYGLAASERLSADLGNAGVTVVSGMARGVDTTAHKAVLGVGGNTVAVFGCGVDVVYPAENRRLAEQIAEKGLLLSEFPMGSPGYPQNFPVRNRIISGISAGVLVVEGAQYSGSAITARLAMDQGREVFAVPGNITSKMSWGPNLLIKQGAKLVQEWGDIIVELPAEARRRLISAGKQRLLDLGGAGGGDLRSAQVTDPAAYTEMGRALLRMLQIDKPIHLDALLESLEGFSSSEIIAGLFELEMLGLVKQLPGKNFVKVW